MRPVFVKKKSKRAGVIRSSMKTCDKLKFVLSQYFTLIGSESNLKKLIKNQDFRAEKS